VALAEAGRVPEAIEHFQEAAVLQPNNPETHLNLGLALAKGERFQEAVEQYEFAIRLSPEDVQTYVELMNVYAKLHQPQEAIDTAEKGLQTAQSSGQIGLADQIEAWLAAYRMRNGK
jgi:tetratricopeptide (TPR) repeat protein